MGVYRKSKAVALIVASLGWATPTEVAGAAIRLRVPLKCSEGPSDQHYDFSAAVPASAAQGSTITVRIDGEDSGKVSHVGLKYIHDMTTEVLLPAGASLVEGSARIVPGTGTANVRTGAKITQQAGGLKLILPARIEAGASYTPPSFEFQLVVTAGPGQKIVQRFSQYRVNANAIIIGDVQTICEPTPKPYPIATTTVVPAV